MQQAMNPSTQRSAGFGSPLSWDDLWSNNAVADLFGESFLSIRDYIWLSRNTESPKQYHLWSLLSLAGALFSNDIYISRGITGKLRLNLGVILTGRPTIRKSSAINFMQRFSAEMNINYGPTDTGGARHGIMAAMQSRWQDDIKDQQDDGDGHKQPQTLEQLSTSSFDSIISRMRRRRTRPSSIYFASKELGRLLTSQTRELLDFFADGLDGESIFYQTKSGVTRIPSPLINLIGATTPGNLAAILPRDAQDHGLLSRLIFVYASKTESQVPIPPSISAQESTVQEQMIERMIRVSNEASGEIHMSQEAEDEYRRLYSYNVPTYEFKLNAYTGRRTDHLARISALICLLRGDAPYVVSRRDVGLAHLILILTEVQMDGAYLGLDKTIEGRAYYLLRDMIESMDHSISDADVIKTYLSRIGLDDDDATKMLKRLVAAGRLKHYNGQIALAYSTGGENARVYCLSLQNRLQSGA